ncbi:tetratricopeptide repeat protein [Streptomyces sp. NPDC052043]|uniref:tetratricopeptide repeat protein n=1 Tax=Streptomyces sp. NPDC052043 TaxID=3365684 RepID=UPI0037CD62AD
MSRLSRGKKREHERAAQPAAPVATPVAVHVPADGAGASVGGVPVHPAPGEEVQQAVLDHLHRIALTCGHPVLATVTDERIGYVVPLQVRTDGSSAFAAEPLRTAPPDPPAGVPGPGPAARPEDDRVTHVLKQLAEPPREPRAADRTPHAGNAPTFPLRAVPEPQAPSTGAAPAFASPASPELPSDTPFGTAVAPTGVFGPPPAMDASPADPNPQPERPTPADQDLTPADQIPVSADRALVSADRAPGPADRIPVSADRALVSADRASGPADRIPVSADRDLAPADQDPASGCQACAPAVPGAAATSHPPQHAHPAHPHPGTDPDRAVPDGAAPDPLAPDRAAPDRAVPDRAVPDRAAPDRAAPDPLEPDPKPTPARGFDAVAEAVLGEDPRTAAGEAGVVLFAEPLARVNEAVKEGRIEEAATLAERTVADASGTLGPEHPEVLRVRELTAYIAYLAGDPLRSFGISLALARIRHRARDTDAAYGDVQSASAAWRAVRDPEQGLRLGRELIDLWAELAAEDGPAADDIEQLESARARMDRLARRARTATPPPTG